MGDVDLDSVAAVAVNQVYRKYNQWVEREDLQQESALWMWQHQERIQSKLDRSESDGAAANWIRSDLASHLESLARIVKAQASGYEPEDDQWYSKGIIALVLPYVLTGNREGPSGGLDGLPRAQNDPAHGNTWAAMYADVSKALKGLDGDDIHLLVARYHEELTYDALAEKYGWGSSSTAQAHVRKAEGRLVEALGGYEPKGCSSGCSCWEHDERLRRRPGKNEETW